jgi:hypothetical protein
MLFNDNLVVLDIIMAQLSQQEHLHKLGERGQQGALNKMGQLHDTSSFIPRDPQTLTQSKQRNTLYYIYSRKKRE